MIENLEEEQNRKGKYVLIRGGDEEEETELGGLFYKPLPCFGFGIGWFSFLVGFFFPFAWYIATFLYLTNYYRRDPRERAGLAASAIAALSRCIFFLGVSEENSFKPVSTSKSFLYDEEKNASFLKEKVLLTD